MSGGTNSVLQHSVHGLFLPKRFFVTKGCATSSTSPLNAFDAALLKAGIAQCNLVSVSSILPPDAEKIDHSEVTPGTMTFSVLARMDGDPGETIGAGIGWAFGVNSAGKRYGIVTEAHGYKDREAIERELKSKLQGMTKLRQMQITTVETIAEFLEVPKGKYGCAIVALVYVPWDAEESMRPEIIDTVPLDSYIPKAIPVNNGNSLMQNKIAPQS